jgi:hypothetical protein
MIEIGRKGIRALAPRDFGGSIGEVMEWLRTRRSEHQIAALLYKYAYMIRFAVAGCGEGPSRFRAGHSLSIVHVLPIRVTDVSV